MKISVNLKGDKHYVTEILNPASTTFSSLHEECVRAAKRVFPEYAVENTRLEVGGSIEWYRDLCTSKALILKEVNNQPMVGRPLGVAGS